jgi:hypothetical protein
MLSYTIRLLLYKIGRIVGSHGRLSECCRAHAWMRDGYARLRSWPERLLRLLVPFARQPLRVRRCGCAIDCRRGAAYACACACI